ncbi:MAG: hypothetical protein PHG35_01540 [Dehalococcoidales bacterium]|nr:hypothetical protein [Dehalococcoidales bacterium]
MRILFTLNRIDNSWVITCPSDKSISQSTHATINDAIDEIMSLYPTLQYFEIVIPQFIPTPIIFHKRFGKRRIPIKYKTIKTTTISKNSWGDKPIPEGTIEFRKGMIWVVAFPPYDKKNIRYFRYPLPNTKNITSGEHSSYDTLQIFGGKLTADVYIDLGWDKVHIYPDGENLKMEYLGAKEAVKARFEKSPPIPKDKRILEALKKLLDEYS